MYFKFNSSNTTSPSSGADRKPPDLVSPGVVIFFCIIMASIILTAIFGNSLVITAVRRTRTLRTTSAILVVNLACVDLAVTIAIVPFVIVIAAAHGWIEVLPHQLCEATGFMNAFLTAAQIMALLHISINRFVAVAFPHSYETRLTKRVTMLEVSFGWGYSLFWTLMPFYGWGDLGFIKGTLFCNILWSQEMSYAATVQVMCYFIPTAVAAVLYVTIYIYVRRQSKRAKKRSRSTLSLDDVNAVTQSSEKKNTRRQTMAKRKDTIMNFFKKNEVVTQSSGKSDAVVTKPLGKTHDAKGKTGSVTQSSGESNPVVRFDRTNDVVTQLTGNGSALTDSNGKIEYAPSTELNSEVTQQNESDNAAIQSSRSDDDTVTQSRRSDEAETQSAGVGDDVFTAESIGLDNGVTQSSELDNAKTQPNGLKNEGASLGSTENLSHSVTTESVKKEVKAAAQAEKGRRRRRRILENRVTRTLLAVGLAFAVCWFPRGVANLWALAVGREHVPRWLEYASTAFVFANSCVNPILYGALHQDFNRAFKDILCCNKYKRRSRSRSEMEFSISGSAMARPRV